MERHPETTCPKWCTSIKGFHNLVQRRCCAPGHHCPGCTKRRTPLQRCLQHGMPRCAKCLPYRQGTHCAAGHHEGRLQKPGPCPKQKACALGPPVLPSTPTSSGTDRLPSSALSALAVAVSSSSMQHVGDTQRRLSLSSSPSARRPAQEPHPPKKPWRSQSEGTPSTTSSGSKRRPLDSQADEHPSPALQHTRRRMSGSAMGPWVVSTGGASPMTPKQP